MCMARGNFKLEKQTKRKLFEKERPRVTTQWTRVDKDKGGPRRKQNTSWTALRPYGRRAACTKATNAYECAYRQMLRTSVRVYTPVTFYPYYKRYPFIAKSYPFYIPSRGVDKDKGGPRRKQNTSWTALRPYGRRAACTKGVLGWPPPPPRPCKLFVKETT